MPSDPADSADGDSDAKPAAKPTPPQNLDAPTHHNNNAKNPLRRSSPAKQSALRQELEMLHKEMEVAQYAKSKAGQSRRVVPRHLSTIHTKRRRALERIDRKQYGHELTERAEKRLRGSMAAVEDDVVRMSQVFPDSSQKRKKRKGDEEVIELEDSESSDPDEADDAEEAVEESDVEDENAESENEEDASMDSAEEGGGSDSDTDDDEEEEDKSDQAESDEEENVSESEGDNADLSHEEQGDDKQGGEKNAKESKEDEVQADVVVSIAPKQASRTRMGGRKKLYRMRNFKSYKLAQRHGEALGFLVRGQPQLAVSRLKQLAKELPKAPQIYSSLGEFPCFLHCQLQKLNIYVGAS